ncbi:MAG TPA: hypothetical protein VF942_18875 [Acidimicrobiales bacterium]
MRLYEKLAFTRVRMGRFTPPPSVKVCAMLSGGRELWPVAGAPAASPAQPPEATGAGRPKHGLSALTALRSFWKMDSV